MLTRRYFRLRTLGQLTLASVVGDTETAEDVRPRHLVVLAVLALAERPVTRDALVVMFWGGETEERARHSLSNALSGLRALLGPDAITARRDQVSISLEGQLEVDALQFAAACEVHDDALAAPLYRGPLLDGVHVTDSPEFDQWLARERGRFERRFLEVCERHAPALLRSARWDEAATLAERWLHAAPTSAPAFIALLRARSGPGAPASLRAALADFDRLADWLDEQHGARPDAVVVAFADRLRAQLPAHEERLAAADVSEPRAAVAPGPSAAPAAAAAPSPLRAFASPQPGVVGSSPPSHRRWRWAALGVAALVLTLAALWAARRSPATAADLRRPVVAVTAVSDVRGDSSISWLRAGLPRLIATDLDAMGGVEVVAPSRVRDVIVRLTGSGLATLDEGQSADVARRVGATWVVTGGVSTANGGYLLDVTARNVADRNESESFTVFSGNPMALAHDAASRLVTLLSVAPGAGGAEARYSGIGTANADAYRHFVRGVLAWEGEQLRDATREFDAAIALDSGFVEALRARGSVASWLGDTALAARLAAAARRDQSRLPELERVSDEARNADSLGEGARAEALSLGLVTRYPRDPRAYSLRADLLMDHGRWAAADSVLSRELALDSLAIEAGNGPCTPCVVFRRLAETRLAAGEPAEAEDAARRWVALQPDLPAAWRNLSSTLAAVGRARESVDAGLHGIALSGEPPALVDFARTMLAARRFDLVDSLLGAWRVSGDPVLRDGRRDIRATLERERGQFTASVETLSDARPPSGMSLVRADGLARLGRLGEARAIYEASGHPPGSARSGQFGPGEARGFSWAHALEADALLRAGDTTLARAFVDSLALVGAQSYYGRDRLLQHHVRGMLYFAERKYADAERELRAALWSAGSWTRTNVELARAQLARGHARDAIATLRDGYVAALDGMGRYVPHSELDWWMARAFAAAGETDSAAVYGNYVRAAWRGADTVVRARLDSIGRTK